MITLPEPVLVTDWKYAALFLFGKLYGRRCLKCSRQVIIETDGVIYQDGEEFLLTHRDCKP